MLSDYPKYAPALPCLLFVTVLATLPTPGAVRGAEARPPERPNIILVLADDLGYSELGCYGNEFNETPVLDRLAARGMRFTDAYAAAPVCSPYRASLLAGQWPARVGITDYLRPDDPKHLSTDHVTLAEALKAGGYATGMMGKWHLTGYRNHGAVEVPPTAHGFDEALVTENRGIGGGSYFHPYHFNREIEPRLRNAIHPRTGEPTEYLTDRLNLEAVEFIERHRDRPFFLYKSHYAVHTRMVGRQDLVEKYAAKPGAGLHPDSPRNNVHLAAQLELIDAGVGMILDKLRELDLLDNTIVIFTSDNGGEHNVTSNAPLRGAKSALYEGGIRVPLVVHWPGVVRPGSVCRAPMSTVDFYPTLLAAAGLQPDPRQKLDGEDLLPVLKDPGARLQRTALYWHYPLARRHFLGGRSSGALRDGDYKLIEFFDDGGVELYNLADDLGERHNLAESMPQRAESMQAKLAAWRKEVGAQMLGAGTTIRLPLAGRERAFQDRGTRAAPDVSPTARRYDGRACLDLPRPQAPEIAGKAVELSARVIPEKHDGVIVAYGGDRWGIALYLAERRPAFVSTVDWERTTVVGEEPLAGAATVTGRMSRQGEMTLLVDDRVVARQKAPGTLTANPGDSIQIGADLIQPVGSYQPPHYFTGVIDEVRLSAEPESSP